MVVRECHLKRTQKARVCFVLSDDGEDDDHATAFMNSIVGSLTDVSEDRQEEPDLGDEWRNRHMDDPSLGSRCLEEEEERDGRHAARRYEGGACSSNTADGR